jgi:hypothetical protein
MDELFLSRRKERAAEAKIQNVINVIMIIIAHHSADAL